MIQYFSRLSAIELTVIVLSLVLMVFLVVDPLVLQAVRAFDPGTRQFFRSFTDLGKSGWILIPLAAALAGLYLYRGREYRFRVTAGAGFLIQVTWFLLAAVGIASIAASLTKNIIGRARPKFFDALGPVDFKAFTFDHDFASFPSGHATTIFALAAALAILWPRARVFLFAAAGWIAATRFLIGSHYLSDALGGAALGCGFPYALRNRMAVRRWLFEKSADGEVRLRAPHLYNWLLQRFRANVLRRGQWNVDDEEARYSGHS